MGSDAVGSRGIVPRVRGGGIRVPRTPELWHFHADFNRYVFRFFCEVVLVNLCVVSASAKEVAMIDHLLYNSSARMAADEGIACADTFKVFWMPHSACTHFEKTWKSGEIGGNQEGYMQGGVPDIQLDR